MTYSLHRGAQQDLADALEFYQREGGVRLARRFLGEFERVALLLDHHPGFGTPTADGRRAFPLQVFPYMLIYRESDGGTRILVVRHQNRDPEHGEDR